MKNRKEFQELNRMAYPILLHYLLTSLFEILDEAIEAAVKMSVRYINDRFLPDKAIDLVDEACAMIRTEMDSMPTELDELSRRIMQLEIEEEALKKEDDRLSQERLVHLQEVKFLLF